jgi:hypothetical protein
MITDTTNRRQVYKTNRQWSDLHTPRVREIVGPHLLAPASLEVDTQEATDLIVLHARDMRIAARVRRPGFSERYRYQFTVRDRVPTGLKTEWDKITEGWADWMFYGHTDENEDIFLWWIIDLHHFRSHLIHNRPCLDMGTKVNKDGTGFVWFDLRSFPVTPRVLVAGSESIPPVGDGHTELADLFTSQKIFTAPGTKEYRSY